MCILHTIDAAQVPFALCLNGDESPNTPLIVLSSFLYDGLTIHSINCLKFICITISFGLINCLPKGRRQLYYHK